MPSLPRSSRCSRVCPSMRSWPSLVSLFFFFSDFVYGSEGLMFYMIFFSGARGDDPHHVRVPEPRGEGYISGVQGGGSRGGER